VEGSLSIGEATVLCVDSFATAAGMVGGVDLEGGLNGFDMLAFIFSS